MNKKPFGLILIQITAIISGLVTACGKANTPTPAAPAPTAASTSIMKKSPQKKPKHCSQKRTRQR